jgi:hypothetical protein
MVRSEGGLYSQELLSPGASPTTSRMAIGLPLISPASNQTIRAVETAVLASVS